jgi:ATP-dependent RNA helicase DDX56/DBP9
MLLIDELTLCDRIHIVQEFNKGVYDYIIATDESAGKGEVDTAKEASQDTEVKNGEEDCK